MNDISDETLMALVDGELPHDEAMLVRERLAREPDLAKRVAVFEASTALLGAAYGDVIRAPVPDRLIRTAIASRNVVSLTSKPSGRLGTWMLPFGLAACLLVAVGIHWNVSKNPVAHFASLEADAGWADALSSQLSGATIDFHENGQLRLLYSFLDQEDRFCRVFAAVAETERATSGIACTQAGKRWTTVAWIGPDGQVSAPVRNETGYVPAGGKGQSVIERVVGAMAASAPLSAEHEAKLIEQGWRISK